MENEFISIKEQLPEKGKDIIAKCTDGETREVFRCACHNPKCREWRCSLIGSGMIIEVESWKYAQSSKFYFV
jgi:hypothetical protein